MLKGLKQAATKAFGGQDEVDRILALPITQLRLELKKAFQEKKFTAAQFADFTVRVEKMDPRVKEQVLVAKAASEKREVQSALDIELNSPAKQLLWAATLVRMMDGGKEPVTRSRLWKQLKDQSIGVHNEEIAVSVALSKSLQNDDVTFDWGQPGSWFYHDPKKNHINLDLLFSLLVGFEHVHPIDLHEVGHSQLSVKFPPGMQAVYDRLKPVIEALERGEEPPEMTDAEQKAFACDVGLWHFMHRAWNCLEDLTVDQFAIDMERLLKTQDFAYSLNFSATLLRGYAENLSGEVVEYRSDAAPTDGDGPLEKVRKEREEKEKAARAKRMKEPLGATDVAAVKAGKISPEVAFRMYDMITWGALLAGYEKNGLFADTQKSWERFRIFAQDIDRLVDVSSIPEARGKTAFEYLCAVSAGDKDSIRTLQPKPSDRFVVHAPHKTIEASYRGAVQETADARNAIMDQIWDVYLKPFADVLVDEYEKQVEQAMKNAENGQQGPGQPQPGQAQGGGGMPMPGGKKKMDKGLKDDAKGVAGDPDKKRGKDNNPAPKKGKDAQGRGGPGWDQDPQPHPPAPKRVGDMKNKKVANENLTDEDKKRMKEQASNAPAADPGDLSGNTAGSGRGVDLEALAKGDYRDFNRLRIQLMPVIRQTAEQLKEIRRQQHRQILRESRQHSFQAEDGDIQGRFDRDKHLDTRFRQATGQQMTVEDLKRFREDNIATAEASIEVSLMIDGSGSMPSVQLANGVTAMEAALQSAMIFWCACQEPDVRIDAYIVIWGGPEPVVIATPTSNPREVGERLESLKRGLSTGTDLAPGVVSTIDSMAKYKTRPGTVSGSSHMLIFSDGDIFDADDAARALEIVSRSGKNISIDVAVFNPAKAEGATSMEKVFQGVIDKTGDKIVGIARGQDPKEIPLEMSRLMLRRVRAAHIKAEPDTGKRRRLRQLHNKLTGQ